MSKAAYFRDLKKFSNVLVRCPSCMESVGLRVYVMDHAKTHHGWILSRKCVFCEGRMSWERGCREYKHIVPCFRRFLGEYAVRSVEEEEEQMEVEESLVPCLECKDFCSKPRGLFGRTYDLHSSNFYDSVFERPDQYEYLSTIEFSEKSGLGRDVYGIVQLYLNGGLEWYHLMVVQENFQNFVDAMEEIRDQIFLLPFWCLCDSLTQHRRVHRHMIIAYVPTAKFRDLWTKRVKYEFVYRGRSKRSIFIKDAFHLIRTIQYVSQRKSSCDGTKIHDEVEEDFRYSHFYMNRPLHEHAIACMSTLFSGGMEKLLQEQNRNKNVVGWSRSIQTIRDKHYHKKYAVAISLTGFRFENCVLPLAKCYEPTEEETPMYLTWYGDKKLYLHKNPNLENMSKEEWYAHQIAKGNTLWSIRQELYVLGPRQQNMMNQIKVAEKEMKEQEKARWEKKYSELEQTNWELQQKYETVQSERNQAQAERNELALDHKRLQAKRDEAQAECNEWIFKHHTVQAECNEVQAKYDELALKHQTLHAEHNELALKFQTVQAERNELRMEKKYNELEKKYNELEKRYSELEKKYNELENKYELEQEENKKLKAELETMRMRTRCPKCDM